MVAPFRLPCAVHASRGPFGFGGAAAVATDEVDCHIAAVTTSPTVVSRLSNALTSRYRVERELGAGGMATVYLARDLRHDRDVAIKVLHPDLGAALGSDRFLAEIRTTARLQHPHILPLLDSGEADGLLFYVMPFVAGETLRTRLERERQLAIDAAVRIGREVADALQYAHSVGIIHRDIKPENILLQGGHALVADFGIALAVQQAGGQRMTQTGLSLGTPQYMSPEQAMGEQAVDHRTDIDALGAVVYEMIAGDPPFTGATVQAIVSKVMAERPTALHTVRDTVPPAVEYATLKALAKLPADRFATASDFAAALVDSTHSATYRAQLSGARAAVRPPRLRDPVVIGLGLAVLGLGGGLVWALGKSPAEADPFPVRAEIVTPNEVKMGPLGLSPDGHSIIYTARAGAEGAEMLYLRRLDQPNSRVIPGTDGGAAPVFSADGRSIYYIAKRRKLAKVGLDGGSPVMLADLSDNGGLDVSASGDVILGPGASEGGDGLFRVNPAGGALVPVTRVDSARKELSHRFPRVLADGKTVLFTIYFGSTRQSEIGITSLDDGKVVPLGIQGAKPLGVVDDRLVYVRWDGMVMAVPFDVRQRKATGTPAAVQDSVRMWYGSGGDASAYLTSSGGLAYAHGTTPRRLLWVDRKGNAVPVLDEKREFRNVRLSPDGKRVALVIGTGSITDIWVLDLAAGTLTPVTTGGGARTPAWTPDGRSVVYVSTNGGRAAFWTQSADGGGTPVSLGEVGRNPWNIDVAPDGKHAAYNAIYGTSFDVETFALDSSRVRQPIANAPTATEVYARFSPDGRLVAYVSDESGRSEAYVRAFPPNGTRVQISNGGAVRPIWSADGREIFYWEGTRLIAATLARDPTLRVVSRRPMFEGSFDIDFDVTKDGSRFLVIERETSGLGIAVIPNWRTELKRATAPRTQ
jgi:serine/threonine-protein kinase